MLNFIRSWSSGWAKGNPSCWVKSVGKRFEKSDFFSISCFLMVKKQCRLSFFSLEPKQWGQVFILSIAWKSTVKSPFTYWSFMISSIPLYLILVYFPQVLILKSSWSPSITTLRNRSGCSARFFSGSILYFSQSFLRTHCPRLLSLHGRMASISGLAGSITLL